MSGLLATTGVAIVVIGLCFAGMAIGLILRGRRLRGGCGDTPEVSADGHLQSCGVCPKKKVSLCESDDPTGLAKVAELGTLGRYRDGTHPAGGNPDR